MRQATQEQVELRAPSPFALALMVERLREELSTEKLKDRLDRILEQATRLLDEGDAATTSRPSARRRRRPASASE
jgi:ATP-dependent Lhr-like helicase